MRTAAPIALAQFPWRCLKSVRGRHVRPRADWRHRDDFAVNTFR